MAGEQQYEVEIKETNGDRKAWVNLEVFRGHFKAFFGWWVVNLAFVYLFMASFTTYPKNEHVGTIVGFLTGTAIAVVLAFFFSGSQQTDDRARMDQIERLKQRLKEKDEEMSAIMSMPEPPK